MLQDLSYYEMENCPAFMDIAEELKDIVGRIGHGVHTDADLQRLQEIIETRGTRSVVVNVDANEASIIAVDGRAIVHIPAQGDEFQAGDFSYPGAEVVRSILESISPPINPNLYGDVNGTSIIIGNGDVTINSLEITGDANESVIITGNNNNVNSGIVQPRKEKIDWQKHSRSRLKEQLQLTTNPLTMGQSISYKVEQVCVPLGLLERKKQPIQRKDITPEDGSDLGLDPEIDRPLIKRKNQELTNTIDREPQAEITKRFEHDEFLDEVFLQGQSPKSQGKRIAIIGEPGAGKTTLLQQIARWVSRTFPSAIVIWVSLGDLKQEENLETYIETVCLKALVDLADRADVSTARKDFDTHLQQGQVWLLLDGLDEMKGSNPLSAIQRQIQEGGLLPQMRIVMTCRLNLWDGDRNGLETFDTYRTLEFAYPQQVELFIEKCFGLRGAADIDRGKKLCKALKEPGNERIRDLMKNPLRLSLMCFSWFLQGGELPKTQAELYQRFVDRIYDWKHENFPTTPEQRKQLNQKLAELSRAAIDDGDEGGQGRFRLRHDFVKKYLDGDIIPQGNRTFFDLALQLGWLNRLGLDANNLEQQIYAFFHPTFEEYFAALGIDDERFFLTLVPKNPIDPRASYRVFEPQWRQVFLLCLGRKDLAPASKEALIQTLMKFKDRCGDFYTDRAFLLAAVGIAEFKTCKNADAIVNKLVQWKFPSPNWYSSLAKFKPAGRKAARVEWATNTFSRTDCQRVIRAILQVLETTDDRDTLMMAAESLVKIGTGKDTAIHALVKLLATTDDDRILMMAAEILGKIDPGNDTAIHALVNLLTTTNHYFTIRLAVESLGKIGTGNDTAIHVLLKLLATTDDDFTIRLAVESLGKIGTGNDTAIHVLLKLLATTDDDFTIRMAAESLGKIGTGNDPAIHALVKLLATTDDDRILRMAAESLGKIGTGNDPAIHALVKLLTTTDDDRILMMAAESLGKIGTGNDTAIHALVKLLATTDDRYENSTERLIQYYGEDLRYPQGAPLQVKVKSWDHLFCGGLYTIRLAAESLGKIDPGNDTAIHVLLKLLATTDDDRILMMAAESLGKIDPGNDTAIQALVNLLATTDDRILMMAVESLGKIGTGNDTAIQALVKLLVITDDDFTIRMAAESLGKIGTGNDTAIQALVKLLVTTDDRYTRWMAVESLDKIGTSNDTAIKVIMVRYLRNNLMSKEAHILMMKCAELLSYRDFYRAFHRQNSR